MNIRMSNWERLTWAEMTEFVTSNQGVAGEAMEQEAVYGFIERVLKQQQYWRLRKGQRGWCADSCSESLAGVGCR
jgi:hypothetical protein